MRIWQQCIGMLSAVPERRLCFLQISVSILQDIFAHEEIYRYMGSFVYSLPRASKIWPDRSVPSGRYRETISLYWGNLTYGAPVGLSAHSSKLSLFNHTLIAWSAYLQVWMWKGRKSYVVENDQGTVDAANGIIFKARLHRGHARILNSWSHVCCNIESGDGRCGPARGGELIRRKDERV